MLKDRDFSPKQLPKMSHVKRENVEKDFEEKCRKTEKSA